MFWYDWTYILIIPGLLFGLLAQARVKTAFAKYSAVGSRRGEPACRVAKALLEQNGNGGVSVTRSGGDGGLTDHFDPKNHTVGLSKDVYDSSSIAALGVAAHEVGHAMQQREEYPLLSLRSAIVPVVNIGSSLAWPIFVAGLIFSIRPLQFAGIILFSLVLIFALITLPVELDASKRALKLLTAGGFIQSDETAAVKSVLTAAAMTYVAAVVSAALQLLRLILLSRRDDR